jgi:hypothetical protein
VSEFCGYCGAGTPPREGEGTCPKCDPTLGGKLLDIRTESLWTRLEESRVAGAYTLNAHLDTLARILAIHDDIHCEVYCNYDACEDRKIVAEALNIIAKSRNTDTVMSGYRDTPLWDGMVWERTVREEEDPE